MIMINNKASLKLLLHIMVSVLPITFFLFANQNLVLITFLIRNRIACRPLPFAFASYRVSVPEAVPNFCRICLLQVKKKFMTQKAQLQNLQL
jgi:hypothetical protein